MRIAIVAVGVVLLVIGAVLLFVPVVPQTDQTVGPNSALPFVALSVSGISLTGSIPVSVSWTSTATVTVAAATCSAMCESTNASGISGLTLQTGTSGSFTLNQPDGGTIVMGAINESSTGSGNGATTTFKITTALSTIGTLLVVVGILLLIVGLVLKSKSAKAAAAAPSQWTPPPADSSGSGTAPMPPTPPSS